MTIKTQTLNYVRYMYVCMFNCNAKFLYGSVRVMPVHITSASSTKCHDDVHVGMQRSYTYHKETQCLIFKMFLETMLTRRECTV